MQMQKAMSFLKTIRHGSHLLALRSKSHGWQQPRQSARTICSPTGTGKLAGCPWLTPVSTPMLTIIVGLAQVNLNKLHYLEFFMVPHNLKESLLQNHIFYPIYLIPFLIFPLLNSPQKTPVDPSVSIVFVHMSIAASLLMMLLVTSQTPCPST